MSNTPPTYPEEKISGILRSIVANGINVGAAQIIRRYRELNLSDGPIKQFCESMG
jgi:hypothetical protein